MNGDGTPLYTAAIVVPADFLSSLSDAQRSLLADVSGELVYTAAYLNGADGLPGTADDNPVATTRLEGNRVLADPNDYADAQGGFFYAEIVDHRNAEMKMRHQFFAESFSADKLSSYNYANETDQTVVEYKFSVEQTPEWFEETVLIYGGSIRYNYGSRVADASPEPFSRRDLSNPVITGNSVILSGSQAAKGGPVWYQGGDETDLYNLGAFLVGNVAFSDRFSAILAGRVEASSFETSRPDLPYMRNPGSLLADGQKNYWNLSLSPVFRVTDEVSFFATAQSGASILFGNSGTILGESNFADSELYETGIRFYSLENKLYGAVSAYHFDREDYDDQTGTLTPLRGKGLEVEMVYESGNLSILANYTYQRQNLRTTDPGFRFFDTANGNLLPLIAGAGYYMVGAGPLVAANNPGFIAPGSPENLLSVFAIYRFDNGFGVGAGPVYRDSFFLNWEHTLEAPDALVWDANLFYESENWEAMLRLSNITEEDYFIGGGGFSGNALVTKMPGLEADLKNTKRHPPVFPGAVSMLPTFATTFGVTLADD